MEQLIENLNKKIVKFYKQNFSDIKSVDIEEIRDDIDALIDFVESKNEDRDVVNKIFYDSLFHDVNLNIAHIIAKFGKVEQLIKITQMVGTNIVNSRDINDFTPLHYSAIHGRNDIAKFIIDCDADKNALTSEQTRKWHAIHFACRYGNLQIVKFLINLGINKQVRTGFGLTPLHVACEFGRVEVAKFLLNLGVVKDPITIDENQNMTPLHYAVVGNFLSLTEILLIVGVDKNKCDMSGFSSLDICAKNNLVEMAKLLLKWGVKNAETSLSVAKSYNNKEVSEVITKYLDAKKCLFNKSTLKKLSPEISKMMLEFNPVNLAEPRVRIFGNVEFNAFGITELSNISGFFSKKEVEFAQFVKDLEILELCDAVDHINEVIVNAQSQMAKVALENIG